MIAVILLLVVFPAVGAGLVLMIVSDKRPAGAATSS